MDDSETTAAKLTCVGQIRALVAQKRESGGSDVNADVEARRIADERVKLQRPKRSKASKTLHSTRTWSVYSAPALLPALGRMCLSRERLTAQSARTRETLRAYRRATRRNSERIEQETGGGSFLLRDLEEALAYEPTPEELGESVIDLTGDALPCIEL